MYMSLSCNHFTKLLFADADDYDDVDWSIYDTVTSSDIGEDPPQTDNEAGNNITSDETDSDSAVDTNPFVVADQIALRTRALPASPRRPARPEAYVIYNGRQMGVFEAWWVPVILLRLY